MEENVILNKLLEDSSINYFDHGSMQSLNLSPDNYKAKFTVFNKIKFKGLVDFQNVNLSIGIKFIDCDFFDKVTLFNISANGYDDKLNQDSQSIVFENCTFRNTVQLHNNEAIIERSILFKDCNFEMGIEIEYILISEGSLTIKNCSINNRLDIFDIFVKSDISFVDNKINSFVRIENVKCSSITILGNNIFNERVLVFGGVLERGIYVNDGFFKKEVEIRLASSKIDGLTIIGTEFEKSFSVDYHSGKSNPSIGLSKFYFANSKFKNGIYINGKEDIFTDNPKVEKIEIPISGELTGDIVFSNLDIGILEITGYNTSANVLLNDLYINQIKIKGLLNDSGLVMSRIKASQLDWTYQDDLQLRRENAIYISDTNFGKAQFFQVDFSSFETVSFHNNIIIDISTSLVNWFKHDQLDQGKKSSSVQIYNEAVKSKDKQRIVGALKSVVASYSSKQDTYRQLKLISQRQGDMPLALEFQRHEMNYYRKIITIKKPHRIYEFLILWSNQSNDFGQNWLKAFVLLLLFSLVSYLPIGLLISNQLDFTMFATSFSDIALNLKILFYDNIKIWIVLLNPVHRISDLNEKINNYSDWIYFWDLLSRVIVSYFIFQMISAFRKFNK